METSVTYPSDRAFLSTDERWLITRIGRLAEKHPDSVNIIRQPQENDGRRQHILPEALDTCGRCYDKLYNCAAELKSGRVLKQSAIDKTTDHR